MRQFDVVRLKGGELAVVIQSELLKDLSTRVIVPLVPASEIEPVARLHPKLKIGRREMVIVMEQITAVRAVDIDKVVASAHGHEYEIQRAYDMILVGI